MTLPAAPLTLPPSRRVARRAGPVRVDWGGLLAALLVLLGLGTWLLILANPAPTTPVDMGAIEEQWGIRITMIGVTGDGGLIDVRYQVTDADKAAAFLGDAANQPILVDEASGAVVRVAALMANKHDIQAGRTYFLLYRNTNGAIQRGSSVSLVIGEQRLEHVIAQ
jgi:hypothetical protein